MRGLQTGAGFRDYKSGQEGLQNRSSFRDFKSGRKDYKSGQGFQIGAKRFQIRAEMTNRGKRNYKPGQEFQIGAAITNQCRTKLENISH